MGQYPIYGLCLKVSGLGFGVGLGSGLGNEIEGRDRDYWERVRATWGHIGA